MKFLPTLGGSMSGSLGGLTASHNKGGQYLRRRSVPTNPNTARQQAVRAAFGGLVQEWTTTLTEAEREAWRVYAANTPVTNLLGQSILLTGQQWFIASNTPRLQLANAGLTVVGDGQQNTAPSTYNTGVPAASITTFTVDDTGPQVDIAGDLAGVASGDALVQIYISVPVNAGRKFFKGPWQLAGATAISGAASSFAFSADPTSVLDWAASYIPTAADDGKFFSIRVVIVYDDGRVSQAFQQLTALADVTP